MWKASIVYQVELSMLALSCSQNFLPQHCIRFLGIVEIQMVLQNEKRTDELAVVNIEP